MSLSSGSYSLSRLETPFWNEDRGHRGRGGFSLHKSQFEWKKARKENALLTYSPPGKCCAILQSIISTKNCFRPTRGRAVRRVEMKLKVFFLEYLSLENCQEKAGGGI